MTTLKELTEKIIEGDTKIMKKQEEGNKTLSSIDKGIRRFLLNAERDKLDQEEDRRETRKAAAAAAAASEKRAAGWVEATQNANKDANSWIKDLLSALALGNLVKGLGSLVLKISGITAAVSGLRNAVDRALGTKRGQQLNQAGDAERILREERLRQNQAEKDARARARAAEADAKAAEQRMKAARKIQDAEAAEKARVQAERARALAEAQRMNQRAAREAARKAAIDAKNAAQVRRIATEYKGYGESRAEANRIRAEQAARQNTAALSTNAAALDELSKLSNKQLQEKGVTRTYLPNGQTQYRRNGRFIDPASVLRELGIKPSPAVTTSAGALAERSTTTGRGGVGNAAIRGLGYGTNPILQGTFDAAELAARAASASRVAVISGTGRALTTGLAAAASLPAQAILFTIMPSELADGTMMGYVTQSYNDMVGSMMEGKPKSVILGHFKEFKKRLATYPDLIKDQPDWGRISKMSDNEIMAGASMLFTKTTGKIYTSRMSMGTGTGQETIGVGSVSSTGFGINAAGEIARGAVLSGGELNALDMVSERNRQSGGLVYAPTINNTGGNTNVSAPRGGGGSASPPATRNTTTFDFYPSGR